MGLDLVELSMEIETEFGLIFSDSELVEIGTVGELYGALLQRHELKPPQWCLSQRMFYRIRSLFIGRFWQKRDKVRPSTPTQGLLGRDPLEPAWRRFRTSLGLKLPDLERPWFGRSPHLPPSCQTVAGVTRTALSMNLSEVLGPADPRARVWERMSQVIQTSLGVPPKLVLCQHHFMHDLGCD